MPTATPCAPPVKFVSTPERPACARLVSHVDWKGRSVATLPLLRWVARHTRSVKPTITFALVP